MEDKHDNPWNHGNTKNRSLEALWWFVIILTAATVLHLLIKKYIMEIKGKVHEVGQTQQVSETFKKRDLVVEYAENPTYPEYIKFEALQDKTALLDELRPGDEIELFFNLRGRPWTDKAGKTSYFNSLVIWKLNIQKTTAAGGAPQQAAAPAPIDFNAPDDNSDLPF